jgi:hypothetical protein
MTLANLGNAEKSICHLISGFFTRGGKLLKILRIKDSAIHHSFTDPHPSSKAKPNTSMPAQILDMETLRSSCD